MSADPAPRIRSIVRAHIPSWTAMSDESSLRADLHLDCIDRMSIANDIETEFGFLLPDAEVEAAETVADLIGAVVRFGESVDA